MVLCLAISVGPVRSMFLGQSAIREGLQERAPPFPEVERDISTESETLFASKDREFTRYPGFSPGTDFMVFAHPCTCGFLASATPSCTCLHYATTLFRLRYAIPQANCSGVPERLRRHHDRRASHWFQNTRSTWMEQAIWRNQHGSDTDQFN